MSVAFPTPAPLDLTTEAQTFYTAPATSGLVCDNLHLLVTNYTGATRKVTVYAVNSGNVEAVDLSSAYERSVPAYDTISILVRRLPASGFISALADATSSINLSLHSGTERS